MRFQGQRWVFRIGNQTVTVDNAFSWSLWGQERMLVNDETEREACGWMVASRTFAEPWLTPDGDGELRVQIYGGIMSLTCEATLDEKRLEPEACYSARWEGPTGVWPAENMWEEQPIRHSISFMGTRRGKARVKG